MAKKRKEGNAVMSIKAISISDALWNEFVEQARREERSASQIIRELIRGYLTKARRKETK